MTANTEISDLLKYVHDFRAGVLKICREKNGIHIGGILSCAEIIVTLFMHTLKLDPENPKWDERDRFILSKGHSGVALYYAMAQRGFFPVEELYDTFKGFESRFGTHPCKMSLPELEISSGALGHGLSIAAGMALAAKTDAKTHRVFCLLGDAELDEGSIWEAVMSASAYRLDNLFAIVDRNRFSMDGETESIMPLEPLADKWKSFNWNVIDINGNDLIDVVDCFDSLDILHGAPTVIIANTTKGKGVSYMENNALYHSASITEEQYLTALSEIDAAYIRSLSELEL